MRVNSINRDSGSRVVVNLQNLLPDARWDNSPCLGSGKMDEVRLSAVSLMHAEDP